MADRPSDPKNAPPGAWRPLLRVARVARRPLERFLRIEAASGILLLLAAAVALVLANSPWGEAYRLFLETPLGVRFGAFAFERSLAWVVNDGLMVIFFFVIGLEIRREIAHGELSEWRRAVLPVAAALGGMLVPAGLYLSLARTPETHAGWGAAMATDIAFAVGILTLLGKRAPPALRVVLLAIAVIDDLGAIVVIALFYSSGIAPLGLLVAALGFALVLALRGFGVRSRVAYVFPGLVAWAGVYAAGVHPTIAGVLLGLMTPVVAWLGPRGFVEGVRGELEHLDRDGAQALSSHQLATRLRGVDAARREAMAPAESLIEALHPWVAFGVMPVFALTNAGVSLSGFEFSGASLLVVKGISVGLVLGKPVGIGLAIWLTLRLGVGRLPDGLDARHVLVLGIVAGIGFTMSLFIAQLAFTDPALLAASKLGVLLASGIAGVVSLIAGRLLLPSVAPGERDSAAVVEAARH
jgi:Na+:H+ antiporter, NhaA family